MASPYPTSPQTAAEAPGASIAAAEPTPEPTVREVLSAAVTEAEAEVNAATQKLIAARNKLEAVPAAFHGFSLSALKAEIEGWFAKL